MDGCLAMRDCMEWVGRKAPREIPVLLCPYAYASARHPSFGYLSELPPNVVDTAGDPAFRTLDPARLPPRFFAVYCFPSPGAERIRRLIHAGGLPDAPWRARRCAVFRHGMFLMYAVEFVRQQPQPSRGPALKIATDGVH